MALQHRAEETRARIQKAAAECFAQRGYEASSVAELCDAAGVSKGAFYHHFPTKQSVFLELLNGWLGALDAQLDTVRIGAATVPDALRNMAGMAGFIFQAAGEQLPMFLEFWTQAAHDPEVWKATAAPYLRYRNFFADLVRAGIAEGSLRAVDAEVAASAIVSLAVGMILQGLMDPEGADWGRTMREGMGMLLQGLEKTPA